MEVLLTTAEHSIVYNACHAKVEKDREDQHRLAIDVDLDAVDYFSSRIDQTYTNFASEGSCAARLQMQPGGVVVTQRQQAF